MITLKFKNPSYFKEGEYKILENTETMDSVSIKLAIENNKAIVYLKDFSNRDFRKVAEYENPIMPSIFFEDQVNYWLIRFMEYMNIGNIYDMFRSPFDCSFDYYYKDSSELHSPIYKMKISSENGNVYFMADDDVKVYLKVFLGKESQLNAALLDMYIKKTFFDYLVKHTENLL